MTVQEQKQPPEVFCEKRCSQTFCKLPVLESLFNKVAGLYAFNFVKEHLRWLLLQEMNFEF